MDAFYASVELLRYPELRGLPVVIGGGDAHRPVERIDSATGATQREFSLLRNYAGRGVVTTATYEARALGVHSAMGMMKAAVLAPDAVLLPVDFDAYRRCSRQFKAAVRAITPRIEDRGIDEIYIDLADAALTDAEGVRAFAQSIKDAVRAATGLQCSIGIAPNKLLAKIASDLDKPDGLTLIGDGDLARADPIMLIQRFGHAHGEWMHAAAHARDDRPVVTYSEPVSISRETTFERDLSARRDRDALSAIFTELCADVAADLRRKGYAGRTIGIKLR